MQPTTLMLLPLSALVYQKMANFYQWCHLSQHKHPLSTLLWLSALMKTGAPANISSFFFLYRVIPVNMKNFFFITSKVIKIEPSYWLEKKQNFIRRQQWFENPTICHYTTPWLVKVVKMPENKTGFFSNYVWDACVRDLLSENVHISSKWMA